ncbi:MAG: glycosyltransferase family 4 protein, partial [Proteobacteria bacterium]|nr:glycosyltransferase family 4 protein [Pseudomonadota bacterium]
KAQKPDYLFVESPPLFLGITGYIAASWWRVPFIFNVADLWPDTISALGLISKGLLLKLATKLEMWLYRKADYVTVVTAGVRQIMLETKQVPANKLLLLPNGVDTKLFGQAEFNQKIDLPKDKLLILYAGTHGYAHGMEVILQAAKLLTDTEVLFLCIGGGSDKQRIMQLAKDMELKNILFWDSQPSEFIANLYNLAFAGIATFRDSPLLECTRPAKTLPILASSKPVLFSGAGEGAKLVTEAQAGIVTAPGDSEGLAQSIRKLINEPNYATQLGMNGRKYAEQHLDWAIIVADWLKQLEN